MSRLRPIKQCCVAAALPFFLGSCAPSPLAKTASQCAPPSLPHVLPPEKVVIPESTLTARLTVPVDALVSSLEREIPRKLAAEKNRPIGAPGRATYTVRRGKFRLKASAKKVSVTVPVEADIRVCKPFGAMCVGYGQCSPAWNLTYSIENSVGEDFSLFSPKVRVKNTKRCVIGIDVTPRLDAIVEKEARKARQQMAEELPELDRTVKDAWPKFGEAISLADGKCAHLVPEGIGYVPIDTEKGDLSLEVVLRGRIVPAVSCDQKVSPPEQPAPLRLTEKQGKRLDDSRIWFPDVVSWADLRADLAGKLVGPVEGLDDLVIQDLQLLPTNSGLMLGLNLTGTVCATVWIHSQPAVAGDGALHLTDLVWQKGTSLSDAQREVLERAVGQKARRSSNTARWVEQLAKGEWARQAEEGLPPGWKLEWLDLAGNAPGRQGTAITGGRAVPGPEGLWLFLATQGHVSAVARPR